MLIRVKRVVITFHRGLNLTKEESLAIYPAMVGLFLIIMQVIGTWLFGLDRLYIGFVGFILLFIGSLLANVLKTKN